jgi:hypothetical protein
MYEKSLFHQISAKKNSLKNHFFLKKFSVKKNVREIDPRIDPICENCVGLC